MKKFLVTIIVFSILAIGFNDYQLAFAGSCETDNTDSDGDGICNNVDPDDLDPCIPIADSPACIDSHVIGGKIIPIDSTSLLLAGVQANSVWILSTLAVIGSVAFGTLYITTKRD